MTPPERFALSDSDKTSPTWLRIKKHLQARAEALRNELEQDLPEDRTAKVRGRLAEVRALLSVEKDPPPT